MGKIYILTEDEIGTIAELILSNTTRQFASQYAVLLADEIEGKGLARHEIVNLFEGDDGKVFPETTEGLNNKFANRAKETSEKISGLAADYLNFTLSDLDESVATDEEKKNLVKVIRSLSGSALVQDQTKGKKSKAK